MPACDPFAEPADLPAADIDALSLGVSRDVPANTASLLAEGLARLLRGRRPEHVVNPENLDRCFRRPGFPGGIALPG